MNIEKDFNKPLTPIITKTPCRSRVTWVLRYESYTVWTELLNIVGVRLAQVPVQNMTRESVLSFLPSLASMGLNSWSDSTLCFERVQSKKYTLN